MLWLSSALYTASLYIESKLSYHRRQHCEKASLYLVNISAPRDFIKNFFSSPCNSVITIYPNPIVISPARACTSPGGGEEAIKILEPASLQQPLLAVAATANKVFPAVSAEGLFVQRCMRLFLLSRRREAEVGISADMIPPLMHNIIHFSARRVRTSHYVAKGMNHGRRRSEGKICGRGVNCSVACRRNDDDGAQVFALLLLLSPANFEARANRVNVVPEALATFGTRLLLNSVFSSVLRVAIAGQPAIVCRCWTWHGNRGRISRGI